MKDRISQLPDELLVQILSLLRTREAGRSSVLSRRWKDLWKLTTSMVFDSRGPHSQAPRNRFDERRKNLQLLERSNFVTWVNRVLTLHESPSLDKFCVQFSLGARFSDQIDEWIKFVTRKRVKVLEIDLIMHRGTTCLGEYYGFSEECYRSFKSVSNLSSIQCLTSVSLSYVNVDGELFEYLLSNCPCLETLSIAHSQKRMKLKVTGASVQLKHLKIEWCSWKSIELSAPKLVTFHCYGSPLPDFHMGGNPLLSELIIRGGYGDKVTSSLVPFSSHLPQLKTLSLAMWIGKWQQLMPQIPVLRNMKHLTLGIQISKDLSLVRFKKLIMAAPCLVKFTLKLSLYEKPSDSDMTRKPSSQPHNCLKEVEIKGFVGGFCDLELAKFLLRNAINLEKMVIHQSHGLKEDEIRRFQRRVDVLKRMLPPGAQLNLL